ncbi:MAG: glycosyltransferase family 2 protein [bacterium]|nr:glycosyltransferase family 2 protein [bacterium]MCM1376570.1 glycosyltransferase family 2 protein [Muribaculum sp.]
MKITVIIPNYQGEKYIGACIDSLRAQQGQEPLFTTVVVDNGSTDGSLEILRQEYPEVRVIALSENTGFCHAVNVGIQEADTPYVLLLNNDTVIKAGFIKALLERMESDTKIFSVSPMMLSMRDESLIDDAGDRYSAFGWAYARGKGQPAERYERPVRIFAACGGASLYRRETVLSLGGFDENHFAYLEDIDIGYRARIHGWHNVYEPKAKVLHAGSAASGSRYNAFKVKLSSANNAYVIGKNMPLLQIILNFPFLLLGFFIKTVFFTKKKMGMLYMKGYAEGIARCFGSAGKEHRVRFKWRNLGHYCSIQGTLWLDMFRIFIKS